MNVNEAIKSRRSIRKFKPNRVSDSDIREILEAARLAPSGSNWQPTRYVVIKSEAVKAKLVEYTLPFAMKAPVVIAICTDTSVGETAPKRWAELNEVGAFKDNPVDVEKILDYKKRVPSDPVTAKAYSWLNAAIATDHLILRAWELGLGTCWIGIVDRAKTKELLELDDRYDVVALIPIGYPDQAPASRPRLSLEQIVLKEV